MTRFLPAKYVLVAIASLAVVSACAGSAYARWARPADSRRTAGTRTVKMMVAATKQPGCRPRRTCLDGRAPSTPTGLAVTGTSQTALTLGWTASTDNAGVAGYDVFLNGSKVGTTAQTSYAFGGLACGTSYTLAVDAYDAAGNVSAKASTSGGTSACADTTAPTAPGNLQVASATQTGISVTWTAATDNVAVTGYTLYLNGSKVGTTSQTSYSYSGLSCGTTYTLAVAANDAAGNASSQASALSPTSACPDTTPPASPTNLHVTSAAQTGISVAWTAATDNVGVTGYNVYLNGAKIGTTAQTSYSYAALSCGTSYTLSVAAYDAAGNVSSAASATTATYACTSTGPCGSAALASGATVQHVVWIWMENKNYSDVIRNTSSAPYENQLANQCGLATNYGGVTHPSLPNYVAATSGSTQGITDDNPPSSHPLSVASIFGQVTSKSYEESMPSNCAQSSSGNYAVKHNPEAYYTLISAGCMANDVPMGSTSSGAFLSDLNGGTLPAFSFVTPDMCNDTHDCAVSTGDAWLASWVPKIVGSSAYKAGQVALFIVWDEDDGSTANHVPALVVSPYTLAGATSGTAYNHYSLLRTTEELLGQSSFLGNAASASSMRSAFFATGASPLSPPPPPPPPSPLPQSPNNCTRQLAAGGDVSTFVSLLGTGDVGCLRGGNYTASGQINVPSGATVESYPGEKAVVSGAEWNLNGNADLNNFVIQDVSCTACDGVSSDYAGNRVERMLIQRTARHGVMLHSDSVGAVVTRNTIRDTGSFSNFTDTQIHGIYVAGAASVVTDNLIVHPSAYGLHVYTNGNANSLLAENTVVNSALRSGALVETTANGIVLANNVFWGNALDGMVLRQCGTGCVFDHNDAQSLGGTITPTNTLSSNPQFVSATDFHLQAASPAVGFSNPAYVYSPDLDGLARLQAAADSGAYER